MNKAAKREYDHAIVLLDSPHYEQVACRMLATLQRSGTAKDTKQILELIKTRNLSQHFYTDNHCLVAY